MFIVREATFAKHGMSNLEKQQQNHDSIKIFVEKTHPKLEGAASKWLRSLGW